MAKQNNDKILFFGQTNCLLCCKPLFSDKINNYFMTKRNRYNINQKKI